MKTLAKPTKSNICLKTIDFLLNIFEFCVGPKRSAPPKFFKTNRITLWSLGNFGNLEILEKVKKSESRRMNTQANPTSSKSNKIPTGICQKKKEIYVSLSQAEPPPYYLNQDVLVCHAQHKHTCCLGVSLFKFQFRHV